MLRAFFNIISQSYWARRIVTSWGVAWRVASRFVAGETPDDAIRVIRELNQKGINATLDHLGENVTSPADADKAMEEILLIFIKIAQSGVRAGVSIKLSQIGLLLDETLCCRHLEKILELARSLDNFLRIDMEDSPFTEVTLRIFNQMRAKGYGDWVGIVIQSYLYRSEADIRQLMDQSCRVRLCKGAYKEPAKIAYPKMKDVDANFDNLAQILIDGALSVGAPLISENGKYPPIPAIASHDEKRINHALVYARAVGLPKDAIEFQMLYGIRRNLQQSLMEQGYPIRVYIPYGTEWYPYFMRRLAERPANLWFFVSNLLRG